MGKNRRVGGIIQVRAGGDLLQIKNAMDYNLGIPKRDTVTGQDTVHGYKEVPQVPFCEGAITDSDELSLADLARLKDVTVTLQLANGKVVVWRDAWYAGEATGNTEEGEIGVRFESANEGEEVSA